MGRRLRIQKKGAIYSITSRTLHQIYALKPGEEVNDIILGLLAKYAERYQVEIFAFCFMSNHFHILARSKTLQLHLFMKDFKSQLAKKINKLRNRTGTFWDERYSSVEVLDDNAMVDKLRYTVCNPCESNLVRHPKQWPGLSSWSIHKTGKPLVGEVVNRATYWAEKRKKANEDKTEQELIEMATETFTLEMAKFPMWEDLDDEAYRKKVCKEIVDHARGLAEKRTKKCLGLKKLAKLKWYQRPKDPKKQPLPLCHTTDAEKRQKHEEEHWATTDAYREAVGKLRDGKTDIEFPEGTIPPGWRCCVGGA